MPFSFGLSVANIKSFRLLLALAFVAGLLAPNHYFPWPAFYNEVPLGVTVLPLAIYCLFVSKHLQLPPYTWGLAILPVVPVVQWIFGLIHFSGDAWVVCVYLLGAVTTYIVGYTLANSPNCNSGMLLRWLAWILMVGALISSAIALRQVFGLNGALWEMELPPGSRPYANLGQPNQLATLLLLGVLSAFYLFANNGFGLTAFSAIVALEGLAFAATQSRAALLSSLLLCLWAHWKWPAEDHRAQFARRLIFVSVACFTALWFLWPAFYDFWSVGGGGVNRIAADPARVLIWQQMAVALLHRPLSGWGWGQVSFAQLGVVDQFPNATNIESSHNLFLDLLIWNGIPLGLLMSLAAVIWLWRRASRYQSTSSWFALALIGVAMVHAMLEFPLNYAYFLLPVSLCVGIVDFMHVGRTYIFPKAIFAGLIAVSAVLFFGVAWEYPVAESRIRQLRFESMGIAERDGGEEQRPLQVLTQVQSFIEFARSQAVEGMSDDELEHMRVVSYRFPFPPSLFRYTLALAINGYPEQAALEMQRLRNMHGEKHYREAKSNLMSLCERYPQLVLVRLP